MPASHKPGGRLTSSRRRLVLALYLFAGAALLIGHAGFGQPDWPFDFVLPQPPAEPAVAADDTPPALVGVDDARLKTLERARELTELANAPSERPVRERRIEAELPPEAAEVLPAAPEAVAEVSERAVEP